ncbi:MAG: hypothetical protein OHK0017_09690 [Patescibacteria group bacterium]
MAKINLFRTIKLSIWLVLLVALFSGLMIFFGGQKLFNLTFNRNGDSVSGSRIMRIRTSQYYKDLFQEESALILQEKSTNNWYQAYVGCDLFLKATQRSTDKNNCNLILADKDLSTILINPNIFFEVEGTYQEVFNRAPNSGYKTEKKFVISELKSVRFVEDCSTYFTSNMPNYCLV